MESNMQLTIEPLTSKAFAPYGQVVKQPQTLPDATGNGWQWWGETAFLANTARPYGIGYLTLEPADLYFDWAERHMHSAELLIPAGGECLVYVGPPDHLEQPDKLPPLEQFRVFRVRQGEGVLLHPGVWHGAPLAIDRPLNVVVLLQQGTGSADTSLVRFANTPVSIQLPIHNKR
jgi:ureidoglycolate hydrolase